MIDDEKKGEKEKEENTCSMRSIIVTIICVIYMYRTIGMHLCKKWMNEWVNMCYWATTTVFWPLLLLYIHPFFCSDEAFQRSLLSSYYLFYIFKTRALVSAKSILSSVSVFSWTPSYLSLFTNCDIIIGCVPDLVTFLLLLPVEIRF